MIGLEGPRAPCEHCLACLLLASCILKGDLEVFALAHIRNSGKAQQLDRSVGWL